eukprot:m.89854 g.89854  ORF g.89854 m.89854 type:complete len:325 (-) comp13244_c0_seq6:91-1065(-)
MADGKVTREQVEAAAQVVWSSPNVRRTPLLANIPVKDGVEVFLKMESLQNTGSFKIRGMVNMVHCKAPEGGKLRGAVTMSAGNAGRSFATLTKALNIPSVVAMPENVPKQRAQLISDLGSKVEFAALEKLQDVADEYVQNKGYIYLHPFDDMDLIAGHASVGMEILEDCKDVDVVVVCVGGGGLIAGVASAIKLLGSKAKVYGVEPEGAPTLTLSLLKGSPQQLDTETHSTIAHGLAAPFTGPISYTHAKAFVDEMVLVSDEDLKEAARFMFGEGFVVETSGCAAVAAVRSGKISGLEGKRVACVVSGRNIDIHELGQEVFGIN